jgi:geranylgeranyl diphosphate synthase type II
MYSFDELHELVRDRMDKQNYLSEPKRLFEPIEYILQDGGKRLRPVLLLMATNLYKDDVEDAIIPAVGVEIFHNYTLLHDDVMDNADIRRGRPTVHKKWDKNVAILSGDAAAITAYMYLVKCKEEYLRTAIDTFNTVAMDVCKGQQYDMEFETRMDVSVEEYIHMIYLKTAALIAGSLKLGAAFGGASEKEQDMLYDFGKYLGIAFQLQDDHLDVYGEVATFGKRIGGDIICNKKTFLLISAMAQAKGEQKERLEKLIDTAEFDEQEKINAVTAIYNELEIEELVKAEIMKYIDKSVELLNNIDIAEERKTVLMEMVTILKDRIY